MSARSKADASRDLKTGYAQLSARNAAVAANAGGAGAGAGAGAGSGGGDLTTADVFQYTVPTMAIPKRVPAAREKLTPGSALSLSAAALLAGATHAGHTYHPSHNTATHSMLHHQQRVHHESSPNALRSKPHAQAQAQAQYRSASVASAAAAPADPLAFSQSLRQQQQNEKTPEPNDGGGGAGDDAAVGGGAANDKAARRLGQLRLPLLRDLMMPESKFADAKSGGGARNSASLIPTGAAPTVKVNAAGDDVVDESAQLRGRTGEEAIAFFARHGNNTTVKFVYCNRAINRGVGAALPAPSNAGSDTASQTGSVIDTGAEQIQYTAEGVAIVLPRLTEFRPYDLVVVSRKELDAEYFTISATGIVHIKPDEPSEFISLAEWMHQSTAFNTLRSIGFFKHYIEAKCFRLWRSNVRYRKYREKKVQLHRNLFLGRASFCEPLLRVRRDLYDMESVRLYHIGPLQPNAQQQDTEKLAQDFQKHQDDTRQSATKRFQQQIDKIEEIVGAVVRGVKERAQQSDTSVANDELTSSSFAQRLLGDNGRIKSMVALKKEKAERVKRKVYAARERDMLVNFVRLVDYMQVEQLVAINLNTATDIFKLFQNPKCLPIFQTRIDFGANSKEFLYTPTVHDFQKYVHLMMDGIIGVVDTVDRVLTRESQENVSIRKEITDNRPLVAALVKRSRLYAETTQAIDAKLAADFVAVERAVSVLEKHRPVWVFGREKKLDAYRERRDHTVEQLERDMREQTDWAKDIDRHMKNVQKEGMFQAEMATLRAALKPITSDALETMKELLLRKFHEKCTELLDLYRQRNIALKENPDKIEPFAAHVETFTRIRDEGRMLAAKANQIEVMKNLLDQYGKTIPINDATRYHDLHDDEKAHHVGAITNFKHNLLDAERRIDEKIDSMKRTVKKNFERLDNEVRLERLKLDDGILVDEKAIEGDLPKEARRTLEQIEKQLDAFRTQTATLRGYQKLFFDYQTAKYNVDTNELYPAGGKDGKDGKDGKSLKAGIDLDDDDEPQPLTIKQRLEKKEKADREKAAKAAHDKAQQKALLFEPIDLKLLPETEKVFDRKKRFWEKYDEWCPKRAAWDGGKFATAVGGPNANANQNCLDVELMDKQIKELYNVMHTIKREADREAKRDAGNAANEAKDAALLEKVKKQIAEYKAIMPLVVDLGNKALTAVHWKNLFAQCGKQWTEQPITLSYLMKIQIFEHKQQISEVCESAVGEFGLRSTLQKIVHGWESQTFVLQPYAKTKESKDVMILSDVDDITALLEDNQVTLSGMFASRFVNAMHREVEQWSKNLSALNEVLDEWLTCQRDWMYLEPIFGVADIQKQLPQEATMFAGVDRFWKDFMRKVSADRKVLTLVRRGSDDWEIPLHALHKNFESNNKQLDKIIKHLEQYLETKRLAFPRFYFLSNDELLKILSQSRDPQAVQPHLVKCFDNITSLIFTDTPNSEEVIGMVSGEGERVKFLHPVMTKGNPENWLNEVEKRMITTIKYLIKKALKQYPVNGLLRDKWLMKYGFPSQPVLAVDQIIWTAGASRALRAVETGSEPHALKEFSDFTKLQIQAMVSLVRTELTPLQRQMMSSLLILDVHARDVVSRMVEQKCSRITDFEWIKQLRYYWIAKQDGDEEHDDGDEAGPGHAANAAAAAAAGDEKKGAVDKKSDSKSDEPIPDEEDGDDVPDTEDCIVRQTNARFIYGYEYLGNTTRLVITPLTDKAYLTLTGALHLHYGGAPAGPAGTGKTETVKDLAKALALRAVVYNCSDRLDVKFMAQYFSGFAQTGQWSCFDEFNRIDVEVLSVIAQQILTIQQAVAAQKSRFEFESKTISLVSTCGVFITMNPNYAGRQELPDNLKALFRPIAMMVPDYGLIAQISLFSQGFQSAFKLSAKMVQLYKLASEQLSKQFHYDFGMRAVKSVLDMAGALKRNAPDVSEDVLLIRAMRDSNIPKFLGPDLPLFERIIQDLFPGVAIANAKHPALRAAIEEELKAAHLQPVKAFVEKIVQLHETMMVRHGCMLVGPTATGKTTAYTILSRALTALARNNIDAADPFFREVLYDVFNPKAISMDEMYGKQHPVTNDWVDGLVGFLVRKACDNRTPTRKWIVFDGPVDAIWIENLNTVLDDTKALCLANGERIKIPNDVTFMFEVEDLSQASLATISRNGMVCIEPNHLGWLPLLESWSEHLRTRLLLTHYTLVMNTLKTKIDSLLGFVRAQPNAGFLPVDNNLVTSCLNLFDSLLPQSPAAAAAAAAAAALAAGAPPAAAVAVAAGLDVKASDAGAVAAAAAAAAVVAAAPSRLSEYSEEDMGRVVASYLFLSIVWSFGATLSSDASRAAFNLFVRQQLGAILVPKLPSGGLVYDYWLDTDTLEFVHWDKRVAPFHYDIHTPYFNILVPTADTTKFTFLLSTLVGRNHNVLFMGDTGVGKSVIVQEFMAARAGGTVNAAAAGVLAASGSAAAVAAAIASTSSAGSDYYGIPIMFSGQTAASNLKDVLESKLEKKPRALGAPVGKSKVILFVDDLNMPKCEQYGAQPPIELLRQCIDAGGFWDRKKKKPVFRLVTDVIYVGACAPPGGGRQKVTPRLLRHYHQIWQPVLSEGAMRTIFTSILSGFLGVVAAHFQAEHKLDVIASSIVDSSIGIYGAVQQRFLPAPATSHYTFNLRDLSKVIQGITQIQKESCPNLDALVKCWCHESSRVFRDRLVDDADRAFFDNLLAAKVKTTFGYDWKTSSFRDRLFGDYLTMEDRQYQEIKNEEKLVDLLKEYLEEYNNESPQPMDLVFFRDAIAHLSRIARIIRQPRGNALLVGVGGSGRSSLTRLAAHMSDYKLFQIEITRNFGEEQWRASLKKLLTMAGPLNQPVVFLFSDSQVLSESYLENINNLLNAGEVPNLFEPEEIEDIITRVRPLAKVAGKPETKEGVLSHFVQMVRENLHVVLCFSPIGDQFRYRCRQYPSFVNCCTIDWYNEWPEQALLSVAERALTQGPSASMQQMNAYSSSAAAASAAANAGIPFIQQLGIGSHKDALCRMCVRIHNSVTEISARYQKDLRRYNYTTPTSYLELIRMFTRMLLDERDKVQRKIDRYRNGLKRLVSTNKLVEELRADLITLQPELTKAAAATADLVTKLSKEKKELDEKNAVFSKDVEATKEATEKVQAIRDSCEADLKEALPEYLEAIKALNTIKKEHITVLKSFREPPASLEKVMNAVCLLFADLNYKETWNDAKTLISKMDFLKMCKEYDKDHIPEKTLKRLRHMIQDEDMNPDKLESVSAAAVYLCKWVRAMVKYAKVAKKVEPKKKALAESEEVLDGARVQLKDKESKLSVMKDAVARLESDKNRKERERDELEAQKTRTKTQLTRAEKLVLGLGSEEKRWTDTAAALEADAGNLVGNIMLSAGCISYGGPFTSAFRRELIDNWNKWCLELGVPVDARFDLIKVLAEPVQVRDWHIMGLPQDQFSTENALIVTLGRRWPLMIDPQSQANRWIKALNKSSQRPLDVLKLSDDKYIQRLETAIRYGKPVLLENVEEKLDAAIEPVLLKQLFKKGGVWRIRLGDPDGVEYSSDFRLYITTKLSNPHYLPEVFVKVTIINFTVTPRGLEDQLLAELCKLEKPDDQEAADKLIVQIANFNRERVETENKILNKLMDYKGFILDDEQLIDTLNQSKSYSVDLAKRTAQAEETAKKIAVIREEYRVVAIRASILYFVVADLARVDPMYQYSLLYFTNLYKSRIERTEKSAHVPTRLNTLIKDLVEAVYLNICRGLFEKDKLLFAFLMAVQIGRNKNEITTTEWEYFVRGPAENAKPNPPPNPAPDWLSNTVWSTLVRCIGTTLPLSDIATELRSGDQKKVKSWRSYVQSFSGEQPTGSALPGNWQHTLTPFQRLLVLKTFRDDRLVAGVKAYVSGSNELGPQFTRPPPFDLAATFADSDSRTPIIFVLSPGANPMSYLLKLASDKRMIEDKFRHISLGQNQGKLAADLMESGRKDGDWVCLQNCHLCLSWMPTLEQLLEKQSHDDNNHSHGTSGGAAAAGGGGQPADDGYRLWLTSMPTDQFPVAILQNSIKVTNEPPKGLQNNIMRTFLDITPEEYESCTRPRAFKKLLFGLAFFHAVCQERRKFGSIGWNVKYEWMNSDLEVSKRQLKMYLDEAQHATASSATVAAVTISPPTPAGAAPSGVVAAIVAEAKAGTPTSAAAAGDFGASEIPWQTLQEIIGDINYCGRVTDDKDQRCVKSLLARYFDPGVLKDGYKLSDSSAPASATAGTSAGADAYVMPPEGSLAAVREYISKLPDDTPETFGLHPNAEITFALNETKAMIDTLIAIQPRAATLSSGRASDVLVKEIASGILLRLPKPLERSSAHPDTFADSSDGRNSLAVFLGQELDRFNLLLRTMNSSLVELRRALDGSSVMSSELDAMFSCFLYNTVPVIWERVAWPSLKSLSSWFEDVIARHRFIRSWLVDGPPACYWLSGFFFPQGFMTAVLQKYSREEQKAIDTVRFRTDVTSVGPNDIKHSRAPTLGNAPPTSTAAIKAGSAVDTKVDSKLSARGGGGGDSASTIYVDSKMKGVYVYGMYLQGAAWDRTANVLTEAKPGVLFDEFPVVWLNPVSITDAARPGTFDCPMYKTSKRAGELSTTGHSTNFVIELQLNCPPTKKPDHWVRRGTALILQLD